MNISEALESGKRYNRAIRLSGWAEDQYLFESRDALYMGSNKGTSAQPAELPIEALTCPHWELSNSAPWYGPAGVITKDRIKDLIQSCWINSACFIESGDGRVSDIPRSYWIVSLISSSQWRMEQ